MSPLEYGLVVALGSLIAAIIAYLLVGQRDVRRDLAEHESADHATYATKQESDQRYNALGLRLANMERDIAAIRQAVAPLPNQGGRS